MIIVTQPTLKKGGLFEKCWRNVNLSKKLLIKQVIKQVILWTPKDRGDRGFIDRSSCLLKAHRTMFASPSGLSVYNTF
jgi:hypothetical protein